MFTIIDVCDGAFNRYVALRFAPVTDRYLLLFSYSPSSSPHIPLLIHVHIFHYNPISLFPFGLLSFSLHSFSSFLSSFLPPLPHMHSCLHSLHLFHFLHLHCIPFQRIHSFLDSHSFSSPFTVAHSPLTPQTLTSHLQDPLISYHICLCTQLHCHSPFLSFPFITSFPLPLCKMDFRGLTVLFFFPRRSSFDCAIQQAFALLCFSSFLFCHFFILQRPSSPHTSKHSFRIDTIILTFYSVEAPPSSKMICAAPFAAKRNDVGQQIYDIFAQLD